MVSGDDGGRRSAGAFSGRTQSRGPGRLDIPWGATPLVLRIDVGDRAWYDDGAAARGTAPAVRVAW